MKRSPPAAIASPPDALTAPAGDALRVSESRYRRLFETARDGILLLNADTAHIEDVNPYLIEMLGYSHAEFLGKELWEVGPFADIAQSKDMFAQLQTTGYVRYDDLPLKTKGGAHIAVEFVSNTYDCDGIEVIQCNIRNIAERKAATAKIRRQTHLYAALSQCNKAIVRCTSEDELFSQICRAAVQFGGMSMAWIGIVDTGTLAVRPATSFGDHAGYLRDIDISAAADSPFGGGPTGTAIRENHPYWCQDFLNDPVTVPWREHGARAGWAGSAALPLHRNGDVVGAFSLYSGEANAFDPLARDLLVEMSANISFALDNFARESQRKRATEQLRAAEEQLHGLIRHLPFPLVLFGAGAGMGFANDRFADVYLSGQLDSPELQRLKHRPGGGWRAMELRRRDGGDGRARAQVIAARYGVLVVIDDTIGRLSAEEYAQLQQRIAELENLSATDRLTGVWNRVQLERTVDVEMIRAARLNQSVTLILLDIDHFKRVNDDHGHLVGDAVLKEFVGRIRERMRATDSLFRWGGDEFVVLAIAIGYRGGAVLAESLRNAIAAEPFAIAGPITASLGVAECMEPETAENWFQRTDQALYAAKAAGRNHVYIDRRGSSDLYADRPGIGVLHLNWLEAYESGEPMIDAEHRELFRLGNALIAAAIKQDSKPEMWRAALDSLRTHVVLHFQNEEAVLARHGYERLAEHQRDHAALLDRARELEAAVIVDAGELVSLVNFVVRDVIARHMLKVDRDFFPLFRQENGGAIRAGC